MSTCTATAICHACSGLSFKELPTHSSSAAAACLLCGNCHAVIPITSSDLEGAQRTETRSTEYGQHHGEGKKPMGQKIKEMLPGMVQQHFAQVQAAVLRVQQVNAVNQ